MERPFRIVYGTAYPHLVGGKNETTLVAANLDDRDDFYYDPAIKLSENDIAGFNGLKGQPICIEHDEDDQVGEITKAWTDSDGKLRFMGRVYLDTERYGDSLNRRLDPGGDLRGISVNYNSELSGGHVIGKKFNEVSLCRQGFFPGANIAVAASKTKKPDYKPCGNIIFKISASNTDNMEPSDQQPTEQPVATIPASDASELAKQTDEMLRKNDELVAKSAETEKLLEAKSAREKELEAMVAKYKAMEAKQQMEYEKSNAPELEKTLEIHKQQYKDKYGAEAELSEAYVSDITQAFKYPDNADHMRAITASAVAYQREKDEKASMAKQLEEMASKMKKLEEANAVGMVHASANRKRIMKEESQPQVVNTAASGTEGFTQMFSMEKEILQNDYGHLFDNRKSVGVTASAEPLNIPVHAHMNRLKGRGMRTGCARLFSHMVNNDAKRNGQNPSATFTLQHDGKDINLV